MRLSWQCPVCFGQIDTKNKSKMLTCPFCGALLIADSAEKKFYLVKKKKDWYFFSKKYLGEYNGYIRFGEYEDFYVYYGDKWYLVKNGEKYVMNGNKIDEFEIEGMKEIEKGKVSYIWGHTPIIALPETKLITLQSNEEICKLTNENAYLFTKV